MSITETGLKLNDLEKEIYRYCCAAGCEMLKTAFESYDEELRMSRDFKAYRNKGTRKTVIKTIMGEVEFRRTVYETFDDEGRKIHVYLLDEALGRTGSGFFSGMLSEQIVHSVCESSYRGGARAVSDLTGQTISHTAAWQVVQAIGRRVDDAERRAAKAAAANRGSGTHKAAVLFEEQDGIWLNLQGKSRKQHGSSKEMKLAIAYDGAKKTGKKRYELTNKVACANFENAGRFQKRKEGVIASTYNVDEIETRLLNGDGASWIKQSITDETVHFQLDPFHRNRAIRQWVKDKEKRELIIELLYEKRIDDLLGCIEGYINSLDDTIEEEAAEKDNLQSLMTYFTNNKDGLVPCHRKGLNLPQPPEGIEYRRMGCMESNVFTLVGNRMKGRRACWSIDGGNNLARLLCLRATKKLTYTLENLSTVCLPLHYAEEITINMTAAKAKKADGKGYEPVHGGAFPALPEYTWLREMCRIGMDWM
jgi:hypothetical protein